MRYICFKVFDLIGFYVRHVTVISVLMSYEDGNTAFDGVQHLAFLLALSEQVFHSAECS